MSKLFISLLSASVLALSGLPSGKLAPMDAAAQSSSDTYMVEAQDMISWMKGAAEVTVSMSEVFQSNTMVDLMYILSADTLDINALEDKLEDFKRLNDASIEGAQQRYSDLPKPERWDVGGWSANSLERKIYAVAVEHYEGLPVSMNALEGVSNELIRLIEFVIDGQGEFDVDKFTAETATVTVEIVNNENRLLRGMVNALPRSSPNHWFHKIMIVVNNSMAAETQVLVASAESDPDRMMAMRQKAGRDMKKALKDMPNLLTRGRSSIRTFENEIDGYLTGSLSPQERTLLEAARDATTTFADAFDVEQRIYELQMSNSELYKSDQSDEDIDPTIVDNDAEFLMLINERQTQVLARMSMLQQ